MGGHGHDEPYYLHAKHMYNLHRMKHQGLKVTLSVLGAVSIGVGVPVYAVIFQQKKTASGWAIMLSKPTYWRLIFNNILWSFKLDSTLVVAYYYHVFLREVVTSFLAMFSSRTQLSVNNIVAWTFQAVEKPQQWYHLLLCGFLSRYLCWARVPGVTFWGVTCLPM